jgi:hypothetical protein
VTHPLFGEVSLVSTGGTRRAKLLLAVPLAAVRALPVTACRESGNNVTQLFLALLAIVAEFAVAA